MSENECGSGVVQNLKDDVHELQKYVFGTHERRGLAARLDITETRLSIFWWVLGVIGTVAIGLLTTSIYNAAVK